MTDIALPLEVPWVLSANGTRLAAGSSSPGDWHALLAGWLLGEGYVAKPAELQSVRTEIHASGTVHVQSRVETSSFEKAFDEQLHRADSGCGLNHFLHCAPRVLWRERAALTTGAGDVGALLKSLFGACTEASAAGGVHGAALSDGSTLRYVSIDVSRHSAVQRTIGAAFLAGQDLSRFGLVLTARISGPMAVTAARAGLAWVTSRSIPTSLAAAIAAGAGLPIVARAGGHGAQRLGA
jgi:FdhD protein